MSIVGRAIALILVILLLPFAKPLFHLILPGITGEIDTQCKILEKKLESSQRLEVTRVEESGVLESKTNVILLGTVGRTTIDYKYTASFGIDLNSVVFSPDADRIVFYLPDPVVLNEGIEAVRVDRRDFFSHAIDKSTEELLSEQKTKCREHYLTDPESRERFWTDTKKAFEETLCKWLDPAGERHYRFDFRKLDGSAAAQPV